MESLNSLSGPLGQRLTWTLLHFLWQGAILTVLLASAARLFAVRSMAARYRLSLTTLVFMAVCPLATFWLARPKQAPADVPQPATIEGAAQLDLPKVSTRIKVPLPDLRDSMPPAASPDTPASDPPAPTPEPHVSALARWQPYLLVGWAIGAGLFGLRLIIGGGMAWRMRLSRRPLDQAWIDRARRLALRMGLRQARVFISERVRQSLVTGLWRPMVLLPAAWLGEMTPEMLEAVLAHELAHLRRLDLWAILLQRLVETFLFYHPAVWWLSRRLNREREMCCDEMAVAATGDRLVFTKALQWAVQRPAAGHPLAGHGPVLGAAWKGSQKMVLERIRRLLGADVPRERFSWWPLGLAALVVPALLMFSALFAKEAPPAEKPGDKTPTLAEIAKANDAAWAAILTVDMEFELTVSLTVGGKTVREMQLPGLRWSGDGARERMHGRIGGFEWGSTDDVEHVEKLTVWVDKYQDGKKTYYWGFDDRDGKIDGEIHTQIEENVWPAAFFLRTSLGCRTLSQLIASGGVTLRGKQTSKDGDTLWVLEVDEPKFDYDKRRTFTRIYVDADKGFLISRIASRLSRTDAASRHAADEEHEFAEVVKFTDCGHGVFFPSTIENHLKMNDDRNPPHSGVYQTEMISATRLSVNRPLPRDAFDFRFPEHAMVCETVPGGSTRKVMIWGPDNKPAKEFATEKDFDEFQKQERAKEERRQAEPKHVTNKPAGLTFGTGGPPLPPPQSSVTSEGPQAIGERAGSAYVSPYSSADLRADNKPHRSDHWIACRIVERAEENAPSEKTVRKALFSLQPGQEASLSDDSQTPFVIGVSEIRGPYATAYEPYIDVETEGTRATIALLDVRNQKVLLNATGEDRRIDAEVGVENVGGTTMAGKVSIQIPQVHSKRTKHQQWLGTGERFVLPLGKTAKAGVKRSIEVVNADSAKIPSWAEDLDPNATVSKAETPAPAASAHFESPRSTNERETAGDDYRIEPPDVIRVEVTRFPGGKAVLEGLYLVGPEGTIYLRQYGVANVAGLPEREAERQIVKAVSRKESGGEYSARVEVAAYNSKVVYVIYSTNDKDDTVVRRLPADHFSTVASAVLNVEGAAARAAKETVWLARPKRNSSGGSFETEVKPIDWRAIIERGSVEANPPLQPGDRVFIGRRPFPKLSERS